MSVFAEFDAQAGPTTPEPAKIPRESAIFNGYYTLTFPDGSHKTFRIHTKKVTAKFAPGKRIVSILIGPDNTKDYDGFGFCDDDGIHVWKKKCGAKNNPSKLEQYAMIIWDLACGGSLEGYELVVSRRCLRCNRVLTDPESVERGMGSYCDSVLE